MPRWGHDIEPPADPTIAARGFSGRPAMERWVVELGIFVCREFELTRRAAGRAEGFSTRNNVVRLERFELPTSWFVARRSIQLSYRRAMNNRWRYKITVAEREGLLVAPLLALRAAACAALSPLRRRPHFLNTAPKNLGHVWRRGRDCSRATPARPFAFASGPPSLPLRRLPPSSTLQILSQVRLRSYSEQFAINWRRGRDSNPRWAFDPYALSRGAPSTTRPPLPGIAHIGERAMIPARSSLGKEERGLNPDFRRRRQLLRRRHGSSGRRPLHA